MAFCTKCGAQIPDDAIFCPSCGAQHAPEVPAYAPPAEDTYVLFPEAPKQEEAAPAYQPPVYTPPAYEPPVQESAYQPPVYTYQPPTYQPPVPTAQPQLSAGTKVKGFIGMGLGIFGLFMSFLSLIIALDSIDGSGFALTGMVYSFGLGSGIAANILAGKSAEEGFRAAPTKLGRVFGLIAIIAGSIAFTLGLISTLG